MGYKSNKERVKGIRRMINNMIMNKKMEKIIENLNNITPDNLILFNLKKLKMLLLPNFQYIYDCIIISNEKMVFTENEFLEIIKLNNDKTGYEVNNTETRVNAYIENENISIYESLSISLMIIDIWAIELRTVCSSDKFCFIISCDDNDVTFRFHKIRNNEPMWVAKDLESYEQPIGYVIF